MGLKDNAQSPFIFNRSHLTDDKAIGKHRLTLVQEEDTGLALQEVPDTRLLVYFAFCNRKQGHRLDFAISIQCMLELGWIINEDRCLALVNCPGPQGINTDV